jgi:hypothetical protein
MADSFFSQLSRSTVSLAGTGHQPPLFSPLFFRNISLYIHKKITHTTLFDLESGGSLQPYMRDVGNIAYIYRV